MKVLDKYGIAKCTKILRLIRITIIYKEKLVTVLLYNAIVRSRLEYCVQAWRLYRRKDIDKLKKNTTKIK